MASLLFLPNIHPSEQIAFQRGGTDATEKRYTTQSTTYHLVLDELQACFTPANHAAFRNLAVTSALTNALYQLERNGGDPRQAGMEYSVTCRFSEGYTFR
ncbi:MAG: hypothetical protein LBR27_01550, partial [Bifidobacteriaceae bacterium]|jgi:hypothetical protein|nr:hypothetical protein [Bifidobacteriaceae bacterium]